MTRAEFAEQLRQTIREREQLPPEILALLNEVNDDFFIDSYLNLPCQDCGKKLAEGLDVEQILAESHGLDDFFDRCVATKEHGHTFVQYEWPREIDIEGTEGGAAK